MNIYIEVIKNLFYIALAVTFFVLILTPICFLIDRYIKWVFKRFYKEDKIKE